MWLLRDPLELSENHIIFTPDLAKLLIFFDGTRHLEQIQRDFREHFGESIEMDVIVEVVDKLDEACLLKNKRSEIQEREIIQAYRQLPNRPPALAGLGYPDKPEEIDSLFAAYAQDDDLNGWHPWSGRGIISPHIDYERGGPVYAQVWRRASQAISEADIVLIFGTDHNGSPGQITLTEKAYATPYGEIPIDGAIINSLVEQIGPGTLSEELHHRKEHSVELSAVWLHHMIHATGTQNNHPTKMIPILCGSFQHYLAQGKHPKDDPAIIDIISALREATSGRRVLAVASVDLAHVGPSFGDDFIMDEDRRRELSKSDDRLMAAITDGEADKFFDEIAAIGDRNRICGFSSIYLLLRFLGPSKGRLLAYDHCPADLDNTSLVSICSMLLD